MQALISNLIRPFRFHYSIFDLGKKLSENYIRQDGTVLNERGLKVQFSYYQYIRRQSSSFNLNQNKFIIENKGQENYSQICIIYAHCNSGSRIEGLPLLNSIIEQGWNLCLFDFSGSGLSDGEYISLGYYEAYDLQSIVSMIKKKNNDKIFLWGRSMGAATIIRYLSQTKQIDSIIGCILDSPYSNLWKLICQFGKSKVKLPEFILEQVIEMMRQKIIKDHGFDIKSLDLISKVRQIITPVMLITSKQDTFISSSHVIDLYKEIGSSIKILEYIEKQHNSPRQSDTFRLGLNFIKQCLNQKYKRKRQLQMLPKTKQYYNGTNIAEMIIHNEKKLNKRSNNRTNKYQDLSQKQIIVIDNNQSFNKTLKRNRSHTNYNVMKRFHSFSYLGINNSSNNTLQTEENVSPNISKLEIQNKNSMNSIIPQQKNIESINKKLHRNLSKNAFKSYVNMNRSRQVSRSKSRTKKLDICTQKDNNRQRYQKQVDYQMQQIQNRNQDHFNPMHNKMKKIHKKQSNKFIKSSIVSISLQKSTSTLQKQSLQTTYQHQYPNYSQQNTFLQQTNQSAYNHLITSRFRKQMQNEPKNSQHYWKQSQKVGTLIRSNQTSRIMNEGSNQQNNDKRSRIKTEASAINQQQQNNCIPKDKKNKTQVFLNKRVSLNQTKKSNNTNLKHILSLFLPAKGKQQPIDENSKQILKLDQNYKQMLNAKRKYNQINLGKNISSKRISFQQKDSPRFGCDSIQLHKQVKICRNRPNRDKVNQLQKIQSINVTKLTKYTSDYRLDNKIRKLGKQNHNNNRSCNKQRSISNNQSVGKANIIKIQLNKQSKKKMQLDDIVPEQTYSKIKINNRDSNKSDVKKKIKVNTLLGNNKSLIFDKKRNK